jgi:hypothetical protein
LRRPRPALAVVLAALILLPGAARGWSGDVHRIINQGAADNLPPAFEAFSQWTADLVALSTDADDRKSSTPGESIRHYIDIDAYPSFFTGTFPHDYDAAVATYGKSTVDNNGILPWAIEDTYVSLVNAFAAHDWTTAVAKAADIGHYVGDLHNPLHDTENYNGQLTNQDGIHSRYESNMTGRHLAELVPAPGTVFYYADALESAFDWIDGQYPEVAEILAADLTAKQISGGSTRSTAYYDALWQELGTETQTWIRDAALRVAGLWYSAWIDAGSPVLPGTVGIEPPVPVAAFMLAPARPNPFRGSTTIAFEVPEGTSARMAVYSADGRLVRTLVDGFVASGTRTVTWNGTDERGMPAAAGLYYIRLDAVGRTARGKALLLD